MIKIVLGLAISRDLLQDHDSADTSKTKIKFAKHISVSTFH